MKTLGRRLKYWLLAILLLLAVGVRVIKINSSLTEWFSWRQTDTAAVGRMLSRNHFNLLKPQYYDLSNIQSGLDNPEGLRMVEFPIYGALFGSFAHFLPVLSLEVWARTVTIVFSLLILLVIFYILNEEFGLAEAFFGGLYFALAPYIVFYSRSILPDMPATSLAFLGIFFSYRYYQKGGMNLLWGSIFFALSMLVKPTVIFYGLPAVFLLMRRSASKTRKLVDLFIFGIIAFFPVLLWRLYIRNFPEGIPASQWLLTSVNTGGGLQTVFFRPAFFRWIFFERISNLLLGGYLIFFLLYGMLVETKKSIRLHWMIVVSALLYLFTFQGGNVQHDYYQILITPALALLVGVGAGNFVKHKKVLHVFYKVGITLVIFSMAFLFSFYQVKGYYSEQKGLIVIADIVRSLTSQADIIVTDSMGDTTLLYLADRRGYPAPYKEFAELKKMGADYFVTQDQNYKITMDTQYPLVFQNDQVLIFAL